MIEEALKSTRNLHRLIIAVSLVTLVFSLSLRISDSERIQKEVIDELIDTDFGAYQIWLQAKVDAAVVEHLPPPSTYLSRKTKINLWIRQNHQKLSR